MDIVAERLTAAMVFGAYITLMVTIGGVAYWLWNER